MNYYGIKREIFKGNKTMPEETIIYPELYKTEEEAKKVKDATDLKLEETECCSL